jgi:hypothetical protein
LDLENTQTHCFFISERLLIDFNTRGHDSKIIGSAATYNTANQRINERILNILFTRQPTLLKRISWPSFYVT